MRPDELSDEEYMELDEEFIVLAVPADSVELEITAKVYVNGEFSTVSRKMDFPEIRAAMREARSGYIPSDALFTLRRTGEEKVQQLLRRYIENEEEDE